MWVYVHQSLSSLSSCHVISTCVGCGPASGPTLIKALCHTCPVVGRRTNKISDPLSPPLPIVHCFWQVFRATFSICKELLYVCSSWWPAFARPCEWLHRSTSLTSSSLLLQQCPTCLVHLTWIVFMMGDRWPYSCCFVECCLQDLFNIACSILVFNIQGFLHTFC